MFPNKFKDINKLGSFLLDNIQYDSNNGFTFAGIKLAVDFNEVISILGEPTFKNTNSDQQQTLRYITLIDHPTEGTREHHQLDLLFWAFNHEPFKIIKFHFNYFNYGVHANTLKEFTDGFLKEIINKFGKPQKKTFRMGKEEVAYDNNGHKLSVWRNSEGIRITLK